MMGVRRPAPTEQARLLGNQSDVIAVANPAWCRQREHALIYGSGFPPLSAVIRTRQNRPRFLRYKLIIWRLGRNIRQLGLESLLDALGIGRGQSVFGGKHPLRPICSILGRVKVLQFGPQLIAQRGRSLWLKRWLARI
jgi:hypothetical protein